MGQLLNLEHVLIRTNHFFETLDFYCNTLGLVELHRKYADNEKEGKYVISFLGINKDSRCCLEIVQNDDKILHPIPEKRSTFGHFCFLVDNIYELCEHLVKMNIKIIRPPFDGYEAFIRDPINGLTIQFQQRISPYYPKEPWISMECQSEDEF